MLNKNTVEDGDAVHFVQFLADNALAITAGRCFYS